MQFSLFGAAVAPPTRADLDGLLLGRAQWVRAAGDGTGGAETGRGGAEAGRGGAEAGRGGAEAGRGVGTARLSVLVAGRWRAQALQEELAARGLRCEAVGAQFAVRELPTFGSGEGSLWTVRTDFHAELVDAARRWTRGAHSRPPDDLVLTAGGLRLWAMSSGRRDESGYLLATAAADSAVHRVAGAQLSLLGVAAVSLGERGGPGWRITGPRRLRRFAELIGEAPSGAGRDWVGEP